MSKRRVSKQQSTRIEKKQTSYRQTLEDNKTTADGLVITRFGSHALIKNDEGVCIHCSIRPAIDSLVAGDRVVWLPEGEAQGVVVSRYPRNSVLGRPDKRGIIKPIAVNITQIMVVVAPKPQISWSLLDSYLVMAEYLNLKTCIILNKVDLPCTNLAERLQQQYQPLGYSILFTSPECKDSYQELQKTLHDETSVFVGQSGVGKSSLIAKLLPFESNIQTSDISIISELGRHTTSNSCFYELPTGGALIDSPGVREFGLWHMPATDIAKGYREFRPYIASCKFRNCDHLNTPGCALFTAVKTGIITRDRYDNYVKISKQFAT
ncbi:small ribosomal subunit biogenesis GTPase RsgA [Legionella nagasakiensis]|uniref:small ribosomal subunit biogenesis GTPase RsgA n=1 Tax=Legionella nagasakiensis TaxID=535290 RepID=UPI0010541BE7|nr:small ribosomal subunit biogenesis GTPase RsgA [Legionella nagasakiensis]